ncbi:MAG: hypothetical protein HC872_00980 [Gammaproteobacteria bacterium]|nr:hypothetical protein [Gammaproteobacteria bacterium]
MKRLATCGCTVAGLTLAMLLASVTAAAFEVEKYLLEPDYETRLARSAAPHGVSHDATIWLLTAQGYREASSGSNGFHCLVTRSWGEIAVNPATFLDARVLAPICYNPEAASTVMQRVFLRTKLVLDGKSMQEVDSAVAAAYLNGTLRSPRFTALGYMMSSAQWLTEKVGHWHPHMMIYAPNLSQSDLGKVGLADMGPVFAEMAGTPNALFVVPMPKFVEVGR